MREDLIFQDANQLGLFCRGRVGNVVIDEDRAETGDGEGVQVEARLEKVQFVRHGVWCEMRGGLVVMTVMHKPLTETIRPRATRCRQGWCNGAGDVQFSFKDAQRGTTDRSLIENLA